MLSKKAIRARREFRSLYGYTTARVVQMTARGKDSHHIADKENLGVPNIAAYKANLTRGTYGPFAEVEGEDVVGSCDF